MDKLIFKNIYDAVCKKISPVRIAGGLIISDSVIRYVYLDEKKEVRLKASIRLSLGDVSYGKIINRSNVLNAFVSLKKIIKEQVSGENEIILSLDSEEVYFQLFNLPKLEEPAFNEAAMLNLKMIMPSNAKDSYCGYQTVDCSENNGEECKLIGAFVDKSIVDDWIDICKKSGFLPVAVEFKSLSVTRAVCDFTNIDNKISLLIDFSSEGILLLIIKNKNLYFDYFYPWKLIQGEDNLVSINKVKQVLVNETGKIMNFAFSKFNENIENIWVNSELISKEIISGLQKEYSNINISEIKISFKNISLLWLGALGAAKRGLIHRSEDNLISLTSKQVIRDYEENQILTMIKLWQKIFAVVLSSFFIIFLAGNLFLRQVYSNVGQRVFRELSPEELRDLEDLRQKANHFNNLVLFVSGAAKMENKIHPFVSKVINLANDIEITRFSFKGIGQPINLNGRAFSSSDVMDFRNNLSKIPIVNNLNLPLANLVTSPDGRVVFTMSFEISSLDF